MTSAIASVSGGWILDSRAQPTVEATVTLGDGRSFWAHAPSGASTGRRESLEIRDGDPDRFHGLGVDRAVIRVGAEISAVLSGMDPTAQDEIDATLVATDGTENRSVLGANAMVAVSAACAKAGAAVRGVPLWRHLSAGRAGRPVLPLPMVNIISGGRHATGGMSIQDVLVVPMGARSFEEALQAVQTVYVETRTLLLDGGHSVLVGDEGGFGAPGPSSEQALALVTEAIDAAGFDPGTDMGIALDLAATQMAATQTAGPGGDAGAYRLDGRLLSGDELLDTVRSWRDRYPVVSVEDVLGEDDTVGWGRAMSRLGPGLQVVGDDLVCTHLDRLEEAASSDWANAVLVKANQIGTLSEALTVVRRAAELGFRSIVSARSGETEDDWLADLAVASGAGQIKVGSVARSERLAKYNRLLRIERREAAPAWAGSNGLVWRRAPTETDEERT